MIMTRTACLQFVKLIVQENCKVVGTLRVQ